MAQVTHEQMLDLLDGQEFMSVSSETVVGIRRTGPRNAEVIKYGEVVRKLNTRAKTKVLYDEMLEEEGIDVLVEDARRDYTIATTTGAVIAQVSHKDLS